MEIAPVLDLMQYFARNAEKMLRPKRIGIGLYSLLGRSSKIVYHPLGVVGDNPGVELPVLDTARRGRNGTDGRQHGRHQAFGTDAAIGLKIGEIFEKAGVPK